MPAVLKIEETVGIAGMVPQHYETLHHKNTISLISVLQSFVKNLHQIWFLKGDQKSLK